MARKKIITSKEAADWGDLPYSQAVCIGDLVFVSGQLGVDTATRQPISDEIIGQTEAVFQNIKAILGAAGCTMDDVIKTNCYLTNRDSDYVGFNTVYRRYFKKDYPARVTVEVSKLAPGYIIEIDAIACRPGSKD